MKSGIDAQINQEIFRKDWPNVIAMRRELASIQPARLALVSGGYLGGQVLARNDSTGLWEKFSAASGTYDAKGILFEDVSEEELGATGGGLARVITSGFVYTDKLVDYDSEARTDLLAKDIVDATGISVTKF